MSVGADLNLTHGGADDFLDYLEWTASIRMAGVLPHEGMLPVGRLSFRPLLSLFNSMSRAVGMWSKAAAVGNAGRAAARCPRTQPVRRRRIVHMSIACRARSARPPSAEKFFRGYFTLRPA